MSTVSGQTGPHVAPKLESSLQPRYREPGFGRLFLGGLVGTVAITLMMYVVEPPLMGRTMDIPRMLSKTLGRPAGVGGMLLHFFNGAILFPLAFAFLSVRLPGPAVVKGLIWGVILWSMAEVLVMPMMGSGFFGDTAGGWPMALSSLGGHLVYGGLQGLIAGRRDEPDVA